MGAGQALGFEAESEVFEDRGGRLQALAGVQRWRRRLAYTVVVTGLLATVVGLPRAAYGTRRIYGLLQPTYHWAVFGPYVNRSHFAGYVVMAIPLALAFALRSKGSRGCAPPRRWRVDSPTALVSLTLRMELPRRARR